MRFYRFYLTALFVSLFAIQARPQSAYYPQFDVRKNEGLTEKLAESFIKGLLARATPTGEREGQPNILELERREQPGTGLIRNAEEKPKDKPKEEPEKVQPAQTITPQDKGRQSLTKGWQSYKAGRYREAVALFKIASEQPQTSLEAKLGLAYSYLQLQNQERALPLFTELVGKKFHLRETLPNLIDLLLQRSEHDKAAKYIAQLSGREGKEWESKLDESKANLLREKLATADLYSTEAKKLADEILAIDPDDASASAAKGWWYYHNKEYTPAYERFFELHKKYPKDSDYAFGLTYALLELNRDDEALDVAEKSKIGEPEKKKIKSQIYFKRANEAYEIKDYAEAENYLQKLLVLEPENAGAKSLLAWTFYNQNEFDSALPLFLTAYEKENKPEFAEAIIYTYEKSGRKRDALDFSDEISRTQNESLHKLSGSYFFDKEMPITAARVYTDPETPYYHADKPWLDASPFFRHKSGTSGFSKLNEVTLPHTLSYPFGRGTNIQLSFVTQWLSSGDAPSSPFAGSFSDEKPQVRDLIDSLWVFTPEISLEKEGYTHYSLGLGITPLNGPVYPVPTFLAEAQQQHWRFNIHQNSVRESILSYVGLEDPFSNREWGRVLKTGAEAEVTFAPFSSYWLTLIAGYDYYWGDNVKGNNALQGTISFGKTFAKNIGNISLGVFVTGKHFQSNSDFFTFGHGGYFSPEILLNTGPTISFQTKSYESFWLDGQVSAGFLYFRTEDAQFFPLGNGSSNGGFDGDNSSQLGFSGKLEGLKLLSPNLAGGGFANINKSADFTEWSAGLTLRYYFDSRFKLLPKQKLER